MIRGVLASAVAAASVLSAAVMGAGVASAATPAKKTPTVTVASSENPSVAGAYVTYTATVTGTSGAPTGDMEFESGGTVLSGCTSRPLTAKGGTSATATCTPQASSMTGGTQTITAVYEGSATYNTATGQLTGGQVVHPQATALSISSPTSGSSTGVGVSVTYTATLTFTTNFTFAPAGGVTFEDGGTTISGCSAVSLTQEAPEQYQATCKEPGSAMTLGSHTIVASYTGGTNFAGSTSTGAYTHVVAQGTSSITATRVSASTVPLGTPAVVEAIVSNPAATTGTGVAPTGTVHFTLPAGLTTCGAVALTPNDPQAGESEAECSVHLPAGTYATGISATYTGNATFAGSVPSSKISQHVAQGTPTVAVASSTGSSKAGVPVTYTATVTGVTGFAPTGTVTFSDSTSSWSCTTSSPTTSGDVATFHCTETAAHLTAGTHAITASYGGSSNFKVASGTLSDGQQVGKNSSTLSIAPTSSPVYAGVPQTWVVTATGGTSSSVAPTGSVTLTDTVGGTVVWRCTETLVAGSTGYSTTDGDCTETGSLLTTGAHLVTATYGGDANFSAAPTATSTQAVVVDATQVTLTSSTPTGSKLGQPVTFTVHVHGLDGATVPPSGTVTVTDTDAPSPGFSCSELVGSRGTPSPNVTTYTCTEPGTSLDEGTHVIHATFNGDQYYASGGTATVTQKVGTSTSVTIKLGTSGTPSYPGQKVTYTATVTGNTSFAPTGPVVFTNDLGGTAAFSCTSSLTSTPPATSTGNATVYTCTATGAAMPEGTQRVTAEFEGADGGDHNYPADASASLTQVVASDSTTTTVAVGGPVALGTSPTYTATVTPAHGTLPVAGSVEFYSDGSPVDGCTASAVVDGVATCTPTTKPGAGSYAISAVFQGTGADNYLASATTSSATQVVDKGATSVGTVHDVTGVGPHPAGDEQTFTADVSTSVSGFTPTGTVTFSDGTGQICTATVSDGAATCAGYSAGYTVPGSPDTITATYNGDANFDGSAGTTSAATSPTFERTTPGQLTIINVDVDGKVIPATQNIASYAGQPVTYVATISGNGLVVPTGKVTFTDSVSGWSKTCTLVDGTVSCIEPGTELTDYSAPHQITATYGGDVNYFAYDATPDTPDTATYTQQVVTRQTTIQMVSASPTPKVIQPVNTLAKVTASLSALDTSGHAFSSTGDGVVDFFDNGTLVSTCDNLQVTGTSVSGGSLTATVSCTVPLAEGTDVITAAYEDVSGAAGYSTARTTDNPTTPTATGIGKPQQIRYVVVYYPTVTNVTATATVGGSSPVAGQTATITATVVPTAGATRLPTGTLTFVVNGNPITCTGGDQTLNGTNPPSATCVTKQLPGGTDVIQADYTSDGTYASSVGSYSVLVGRAGSVTTITSVATTLPTTPPISGQPLRFDVKVVPATAGSGLVPTGTVTINAAGADGPLCTATLTDGVGSCTNTSVAAPAGSPTHFTATYSGDTSFLTSTSTNTASMTIVHQVATFQKFTAVTADDPSSTTVTYGQPITFSVTLSPQIPGSVATGTIAITGPSGGPSGTLCTITLTATSGNAGSCTFVKSTRSPYYVPGGSQVFSASYSGDQTFQSSATGGGGQVTVPIQPATVNTTVTIAPQNPVYGQIPTFHFTVAPTSSGATPAGTVSITSSETGGTVLCSATLSGGAGSCQSSVMPPASQNVKFYANYTDTADRNYQATTTSSSPPSGYVVANVQQATTTTTVTTTAQKYGVGQTFDVSVAPQIAGSPSPSGTVTVTAAGVSQPLCPPIVLNPGTGGDGTATGSCTSTVPVPAGTKITYTASYSGNTDFLPSSGTASSSVGKASTTTGVSSSGTATYGNEQAVTFTATVANSQSGSSGTPTGGTVTITQGSTTLCTATVVNGSATCSPTSTALVPGSSAYPITATYGGNANFAGSSGTTTQTVDKAPTTTTLSPIPSSVIYGNESSITFAVSVSPQYAAAGSPTGTVAITSGSTTLCTATLSSGSGSCTMTNTKLAAGSYSSSTAITATYTATGTLFSSSGPTTGQMLTVTKASTTVSLVVSRASVASGKETVAGLISATVLPQFTGTPTGTVSVKAYDTNGTSFTLCTITLSAAKGSCPPLTKTALPVGNYSLVGTYSGGGSFLGGSTSSGTLAVTAGSTTTTVTFSPSGGLTLGAETSGTFTPTVTTTGTGSPTGTVTVTATNTTTGAVYTVCTLPVATATGSKHCAPGSATLLPPGTYTVKASYPGDANFAGSSGTDATTLTVAKAASSSLTLRLSTTTPSAVYGNETTASYHVTFGSANPAPTGTVNVVVGTAGLCTVTLVTGAGNCTVTSPTFLGAGATHAVVATYNGDANYSGSVSSTTAVNLTVTKATTSPAVSLSESSATFGDEGTVTFTVRVAPQYSGTPTGTVTVKAKGTTLCSFTLPATSDVGSCTLTASQLGAATTPYSVTATYSGDTNFTGATSPSQPLSITKSTSTTSLVVSTAAKAAAGQMTQVGFSATIAPEFTGSSPTPTGTVTFTATNTATHTTYPLCTYTIGDPPCTPSATALPAGTYTVTGTYSGDGNYQGSSSTTTLTVAKGGTSVDLSVTPASVGYGQEQQAVFTATVTAAGGTPTGTVTVTSGATTICTIALTNGSGTCSLSATQLVPGSYPATATYSGDTNYGSSTFEPVAFAVTKATSSVTSLSTNAATIPYGSENSVTFSVKVGPGAGGAGVPSGTVTVAAGATTLCTVTLFGGSGSCTTLATMLTAASSPYTIVASYSGDTNFPPSTSSGVPLIVSKVSTTVSSSVSPVSVEYGAEGTSVFKVTVPPVSGTGVPTGTVHVTSGGTLLCTITLSGGTGTCSPSTTALPVASSLYTVTLTYSGDTNYVGSSSTTAWQITVAGTTTTLSITPASSPYGAESGSVLHVDVAPDTSGDPTGLVTITEGTSTLCALTLTKGDAGLISCTLTNRQFPAAASPYELTAHYGGDGNFTPSTSSAEPFTVTKATTTTTVTISPASVTYGAETAATVSVTVTSTTSGTPTGTVMVTSGLTSICTITLTTGAGTCQVPATALGVATSPHTLTATYSGDTNFVGSSTTGPLSVTQDSTTTTLTATPSSATYGAATATSFGVTVATGQGEPLPATETVTVDVTGAAGSTTCTVTLTPQIGGGTGNCSIGALSLPAGSYTASVSYPGDADLTGSAGTTGFTVAKATTTTTVTVSPASVTYGAETVATVSVTVTSTTSGTPTGTVMVTAGLTSICTISLATGAGTCQVPATALGVATSPHTLTAIYTGDTNFDGSSTSASLSVTKATTTTTVTINPASVTYGAETTAAVSVTVTSTTSGTPTGTVTVTSGTTTICTITLATGAGTCQVPATALGVVTSPHTLTATYTGDTNFVGSSATSTLTVTKDSTTTTLIASPSSATYGAETATSFEVTVATGHGEPLPATETVTVDVTGTDGSTTCTVTLAPEPGGASGHCTIGATSLPAGSYTAVATYLGDADLTGSSSTTTFVVFTVTKDSTTTTVTATPSSATYGAETATSFEVTVVTGHGERLPATETVTVDVTGADGSTTCTVTLVPGAGGGSGHCTIGATSLPVGSYTASVTYPGDADLDGSSGTTGFTVNKDSTTATVTAIPASATYGAETATSFEVTVATGHGEPLPATETVTVDVTGTDGSTTCTVTLVPGAGGGSGHCTVGATSLPVGSYTASVTYPGDADLDGSSRTTGFTVTKDSTTTTLTATPSSATYGAATATSFGVTVATGQGEPLPATETVTVDVTGAAGSTTCTVTLTPQIGGGTGNCSIGALSLPAGSYTASVSYPGDADLDGSSGTTGFAVTKATTTTSVSVSPSTVTYGAETAGTVSVTVTSTTTGTPTGTVTVTSGATTICTITLITGAGTCQLPATGLGVATSPHSLTATYSGSPNFASSTTSKESVTVTSSASVTTLSVTPSTTVYGAENAGVFAVRVASPKAGTPTGTVVVDAGTQALCSLTLAGGAGSCTATATALPAAGYQVVAHYQGDANFNGSSSAAAPFGVTPAASATSVTSSTSLAIPGGTVSFTARVTSTPAAAGSPSGTVTFSAGSTVLCAAVPVQGGQASCSQTVPVATSEVVTAAYSGATSFGSSSGSLTQQIQHGYWTVASDGGVFAFGDAQFYGSMGGKPLNAPMVGIAAANGGTGYWTVAADGGIFSYGSAQFYGSTGSMKLNEPVVGMVPTDDDQGYWLVASDGGIFAFGNAGFYGSMGGKALNAPIVGMVPTSNDQGYWLVGADGGVFAFGDAGYFGSGSGTITASSPVVGLAASANDQGYWLTTSSGGVYAFGTAQFYGSMGGTTLNHPVVGIGSTADGQGYWLVASDGGIFSFGDAIFDGSMGGLPLNSPMVGIAAL